MTIRNLFVFALSSIATFSAHASVTVNDAWIKLTSAENTAGEVYMRIKSDTPAKLVKVSSPEAKIAQIHAMEMHGTGMQMRAVSSLDLPAGKTVQLKADGYHIMLAEIRPPLRAGTTVPVVLTIEGSDLRRETIKVEAEVRRASHADNNDTMDHMGSMKGTNGM